MTMERKKNEEHFINCLYQELGALQIPKGTCLPRLHQAKERVEGKHGAARAHRRDGRTERRPRCPGERRRHQGQPLGELPGPHTRHDAEALEPW